MTIIPQAASRLFSVGEISVQYNTDRNVKREQVKGSLDAFYILRQYWSNQINRLEEFYILCLNRNNEAIGIYLVSTGGTSGTLADPKIVFQVALGCHASSLIIAHNHPSGNMAASEADKQLTRRYKEIGKLLDCTLLDHLILGPDPHLYYSFADEGLM
ncbi:JAB domain-containing protein [Spirosoma aureum]|uniref:JAB domain-containing protein n=1 Tax=Spirosoma aureum TaxID=2692134 RepID=A0A6G9AQI6_9BACT|nr:JAB domain-containing protein [Spirosoma aureum]QIP14737.1 JAB domain-containing protein [Spirosoma aureum]